MSNYTNNKPVIISVSSSNIPKDYRACEIINIDERPIAGVKDNAAYEFVPKNVVTDYIPISSFGLDSDYIEYYFRKYLLGLDPQEMYEKLQGIVLLGCGIHSLIIAAWFELYLECFVPFYFRNTAENKGLAYQDNALYKFIREKLEEIALKYDQRINNSLKIPITSLSIKESKIARVISISKEKKETHGTRTVRGGYLRYLSIKLNKDYVKGGKKDQELKRLAQDYLLQAVTYEQGIHITKEMEGRNK